MFVDPDRFQTAGQRFAHFFDELRQSFVERDEVLSQFALALLCREHVLMTGPPGTAKSQLAAAVLRRIVDETTGSPSIFARQFTENTVQTDLVGPIDFKTLMETGRTEHFTDEGMLGAVHAFLDEVFDGRDNLLRSTLNLLHERELKQGSLTTRGRIECAMMTSNRYIAEVLEGSRETLLAFVDRIAFISFVPRGFADSKNLVEVVRRHGGGLGPRPLTALLTVQDLDVLQAAVESVYVSEAICDALVTLIESLDAELAAASRADPTFIPTRYLSTRTAVRSAQVLRAICVYDKIARSPERPLEVDFSDLSGLRRHLLLAGLPPEKVAQRLERETDPRERRQLEILRTEREAFDRCLKRLTPVKPAPRPRLDRGRLERARALAAKEGSRSEEVALAAQELVAAASSGAPGSDVAARLLRETVEELASRAILMGLSSSISGTEDVRTVVTRISAFADQIETASGGARPTARWLRGRALSLLDEAAAIAPAAATGGEAKVPAVSDDAVQLKRDAEQRLAAAEQLLALKKHIEGAGADVADAGSSRAAWMRAVDHFVLEQSMFWDPVFRHAVRAVLERTPAAEIGSVFAALAPELGAIDKLGERLAALGAERPALSSLVVEPRIRPLVAAVFERMRPENRRALIGAVDSVVEELSRANLASVIQGQDLLAWAAAALIRSAKAAPSGASSERSFAAFVSLRSAEDRMSVIEALIEIAVRVFAETVRKPETPGEASQAVLEKIRALPEEVAREIAELDLSRVERRLRFLEEWWAGLAAGAGTAARDRLAAIERVVGSGFLRLIQAEGAALDLALEAKAIAQVFPDRAQQAAELRSRIERLDKGATEHLVGLLKDREEGAWTAVLARDGATSPSPPARPPKTKGARPPPPPPERSDGED